jgi:hypothetical protein
MFAAIYISIMRRRERTIILDEKNLNSDFPDQRVTPLHLLSSSLELFAIITIITLIISLTGLIASPLFFFLYFVLFLLAFVYSPVTIWVFLITIILYFIPSAINSASTDTFIKLLSLLLIAPIAYFVGKEFERRQLISKRIEAKTNDIIHDAEALREETVPNSEEDETIEELIEEAESLRRDPQN